MLNFPKICKICLPKNITIITQCLCCLCSKYTLESYDTVLFNYNGLYVAAEVKRLLCCIIE